METPSLITPSAADYTMTPTGLEYVLGNYQQASSSTELELDNHDNDHIQYAAQQQQQQQNNDNDESNTGKVVPQVSW